MWFDFLCSGDFIVGNLTSTTKFSSIFADVCLKLTSETLTRLGLTFSDLDSDSKGQNGSACCLFYTYRCH